jgi:hypothetical protein
MYKNQKYLCYTKNNVNTPTGDKILGYGQYGEVHWLTKKQNKTKQKQKKKETRH